MIIPNSIETNRNSSKNGLYESYYFRGNDSKNNFSFWLKHNFLIFKKSNKIIIESIFILFDKKEEKSTKYSKSETISINKFEDITNFANNSWDNLHFSFADESYFEIKVDHLHGKLNTQDGSISWCFNLKRSKIAYYHFSKDSYYRSKFPKKKILTTDINILYDGNIKTNTNIISDYFIGINGHNWGTEHAYKYQYANCNQFIKEDDVYFDGFSAKILLGGIIKSPYLSSCSLKIQKEWFHFNDVISSFKHKVKILDEKNWLAVFKNKTHILEVQISGKKTIWTHLDYHHPNHKVSIVNNTKFAQGKLRLIKKSDQSLVKELESNLFELESLIP